MFLPPEVLSIGAGFRVVVGPAAPRPVRVRETTNSHSQEVEQSSAVTPSIGVSCKSISPALADSEGLSVIEGAYVCTVRLESAASSAGISAGDAIVAIDDTVVRCAHDLVVTVREHCPGDEIAVTLIRDGSEMVVAVTLSAQSAEQKPAESSELPVAERQD